jgi:16S rRNA (adenine1518-N6/adenine1519-N6)-dimethyltransferase
MAHTEGIRIKKKFGQHFLRDERVVEHMIEAVEITKKTSVFEIGCGDGFLTRAILRSPVERLWVFEIDPEWATYVQSTLKDTRLSMFQENFLEVDPTTLAPFQPWTILANLPYQVTFPILHWFQKNRHLIKEGVIMIQEEVAQKIMKTSGRGYGFPSLFFQRYFSWRMLDKVPPGAFFPPPKVNSRLLYFKPHYEVEAIPDEEGFWRFIKACLQQPRRTMRNNLTQSHYDINKLSQDLLNSRAQQLSMDDFIKLWILLR